MFCKPISLWMKDICLSFVKLEQGALILEKVGLKMPALICENLKGASNLQTNSFTNFSAIV